MYDYVVVGGGVVGLATAKALSERGGSILVLEKEPGPARHQTGNNSGVIHSGIYYKPGSLKAKFAIEGSRRVPEFCQEHGIDYDVCGKVIVATEEREIPLLENIYNRGLQNGLAVTKISAGQLKEIEPHCAGLAAVKVPSTGITNYKAISAAYAKIVMEHGGEVRYNTQVTGVIKRESSSIVQTTTGDVEARMLINCAGLHCDRVAKMNQVDPLAKIVPFRGEYFELKPHKRYLVKHLIYPVPNPDFPFLGVHYTRMVDGAIHCGPNAVLAFRREGYHRTDIDLGDLFETLTYKGFWALAKKNWREGAMEMWRSLSKAAFVKSLQRLIPEVRSEDLVESHAGVRAQALLPDGKMVDDFLIVRGHNSVHVCNAPSPAATASMPIGEYVAERVPEVSRTQVALSMA